MERLDSSDSLTVLHANNGAHSSEGRVLLRRADALLEEAAGASDSDERFLTAYLAALRGAGALLAEVDATPKRGRSRSAWVRIAAGVPEMSEWSVYFARWSRERAAVEAGVSDRVGATESDEFFSQVGRFLHAVDDRVNSTRSPVAMSA